MQSTSTTLAVGRCTVAAAAVSFPTRPPTAHHPMHSVYSPASYCSPSHTRRFCLDAKEPQSVQLPSVASPLCTQRRTVFAHNGFSSFSGDDAWSTLARDFSAATKSLKRRQRGHVVTEAHQRDAIGMIEWYAIDRRMGDYHRRGTARREAATSAPSEWMMRAFTAPASPVQVDNVGASDAVLSERDDDGHKWSALAEFVTSNALELAQLAGLFELSLSVPIQELLVSRLREQVEHPLPADFTRCNCAVALLRIIVKPSVSNSVVRRGLGSSSQGGSAEAALCVESLQHEVAMHVACALGLVATHPSSTTNNNNFVTAMRVPVSEGDLPILGPLCSVVKQCLMILNRDISNRRDIHDAHCVQEEEEARQKVQHFKEELVRGPLAALETIFLPAKSGECATTDYSASSTACRLLPSSCFRLFSFVARVKPADLPHGMSHDVVGALVEALLPRAIEWGCTSPKPIAIAADFAELWQSVAFHISAVAAAKRSRQESSVDAVSWHLAQLRRVTPLIHKTLLQRSAILPAQQASKHHFAMMRAIASLFVAANSPLAPDLIRVSNVSKHDLLLLLEADRFVFRILTSGTRGSMSANQPRTLHQLEQLNVDMLAPEIMVDRLRTAIEIGCGSGDQLMWAIGTRSNVSRLLARIEAASSQGYQLLSESEAAKLMQILQECWGHESLAISGAAIDAAAASADVATSKSLPGRLRVSLANICAAYACYDAIAARMTSAALRPLSPSDISAWESARSVLLKINTSEPAQPIQQLDVAVSHQQAALMCVAAFGVEQLGSFGITASDLTTTCTLAPHVLVWDALRVACILRRYGTISWLAKALHDELQAVGSNATLWTNPPSTSAMETILLALAETSTCAGNDEARAAQQALRALVQQLVNAVVGAAPSVMQICDSSLLLLAPHVARAVIVVSADSVDANLDAVATKAVAAAKRLSKCSSTFVECATTLLQLLAIIERHYAAVPDAAAAVPSSVKDLVEFLSIGGLEDLVDVSTRSLIDDGVRFATAVSRYTSAVTMSAPPQSFRPLFSPLTEDWWTALIVTPIAADVASCSQMPLDLLPPRSRHGKPPRGGGHRIPFKATHHIKNTFYAFQAASFSCSPWVIPDKAVVQLLRCGIELFRVGASTVLTIAEQSGRPNPHHAHAGRSNSSKYDMHKLDEFVQSYRQLLRWLVRLQALAVERLLSQLAIAAANETSASRAADDGDRPSAQAGSLKELLLRGDPTIARLVTYMRVAMPPTDIHFHSALAKEINDLPLVNPLLQLAAAEAPSVTGSDESLEM